MKLRILREHYVRSGSSWVPKRKFESKEEIVKELGFDLDTTHFYTCNVCTKLHVRGKENKSK